VVQTQESHQDQTDGVDDLIMDRRVIRLKLLWREMLFEGMSADGTKPHGSGCQKTADEDEIGGESILPEHR
jgi:hypothetical protein